MPAQNAVLDSSRRLAALCAARLVLGKNQTRFGTVRSPVQSTHLVLGPTTRAPAAGTVTVTSEPLPASTPPRDTISTQPPTPTSSVRRERSARTAQALSRGVELAMEKVSFPTWEVPTAPLPEQGRFQMLKGAPKNPVQSIHLVLVRPATALSARTLIPTLARLPARRPHLGISSTHPQTQTFPAPKGHIARLGLQASLTA